MIHWGWLIAAFYGGVLAGIAVIAPCRAAKDADERMERIAQTGEKGANHDQTHH
ncbi:hypothetical protein GURASL_13330 [Geotalea uraniireducens]|uniref:Uncharacterized protein n=1 Tax=Geotalea uraniireducens TaxID=351604 RepID=A0ABN6VTE4_9BACT|nr:hypothetical protein [Geotalea uraniireducens]BDV42410.1 hypothetical protein GURASL_13330 [Geotalea uraniireducens]